MGKNDALKLITLLDVNSRRGPPTQFKSWHLLTALLIYNQERGPIGRYQLAEELDLGDGSIRSLVKFLRRQGLIRTIGRQGHQLSKEGKGHIEKLHHVLINTGKILQTSFTVDQMNYGCHLRNRAHFVTDGVPLRDAAMRAGASGATTFIQGPNPEYLIMPTEYRVPRIEVAELLKEFNLVEGDVIIIGTGPTDIVARLGAMAATMMLLD
jgi:DNA-binding transcriptional regulator LsrR (DeoR family)